MAILTVCVKPDGRVLPYTPALEAKGLKVSRYDTDTRQLLEPIGPAEPIPEPAAPAPDPDLQTGVPGLPPSVPVLRMPETAVEQDEGPVVTMDKPNAKEPWTEKLDTLPSSSEGLQTHALLHFYMELPDTLTTAQMRHILDKTYQACAAAARAGIEAEKAAAAATKAAPPSQPPATPQGQALGAPPQEPPAPVHPEVAKLQSLAEMREHAIAVFGQAVEGRTKDVVRAHLNEMYRTREVASGGKAA